MSPVSLRLSCLAVLAVAWSSATCLAPDPNHCAQREGELRGHAWCAERYPALPLCSRCETSENGRSGCTDRDDRSECLIGDPQPQGTTEASSGTTTDGSTTATAPCTQAECAALDATRPLCNDDEDHCIPCDQAGGDEACAAADPDRPACVMDGELAGACVECTNASAGACTAGAPICDAERYTCVACRSHSECMATFGSACRMETGECLPPELVRHVDASAPQGGDGTAAMPFSTIAQALNNPDLQDQGTIVLHDGEYSESSSVGGGRAIAIVAAQGEQPTIADDAVNGIFTAMGSGTELYLDGLTIRRNGEGPGLRIASGATAHVDRCLSIQNAIGIEVTGGGRLVLRNSIVTTALSAAAAVSIADGATADVTYSTLFNTATGGIETVLCMPPVGAVTVRNSVILARATNEPSGWSCTAGTVSHSVGENIPADGTSDNLLVCGHPDVDCDVDASLVSLFSDLTSLRLTADGAAVFLDVPAPSADDPAFDIDGNPRAPERDFAGAHAPPRG